MKRIAAVVLAAVMVAALLSGGPVVEAQSASDPIQVLIMGDSFSAGNGSSLDTDADFGPGDGCWRGTRVWGELVAERIRVETGRSADQVVVDNVACSGAKSSEMVQRKIVERRQMFNVFPIGAAESEVLSAASRECNDISRVSPLPSEELWEPQVVTAPNGFATYCNRVRKSQVEMAAAKDYDLILMTAGGNDLNFSAIVRRCLLPAASVPGVSVTSDQTQCASLLADALRQVVPAAPADNGINAALRAVLRPLVRPATKVVLMQYPSLIRNPDYSLGGLQVGQALAMLQEFGDAAQRSALADSIGGSSSVDSCSFDQGVFGGDVRAMFSGFEPQAPLGFTTPDSQKLYSLVVPAYVPGVPVGTPIGPLVFTAHPTPAGHRTYADAAYAAIRSSGDNRPYCGTETPAAVVDLGPINGLSDYENLLASDASGTIHLAGFVWLGEPNRAATGLRIFNLDTRQMRVVPLPEPLQVNSYAVSADGKSVALAAAGNDLGPGDAIQLLILDIATGEVLQRWTGTSRPSTASFYVHGYQGIRFLVDGYPEDVGLSPGNRQPLLVGSGVAPLVEPVLPATAMNVSIVDPQRDRDSDRYWALTACYNCGTATLGTTNFTEAEILRWDRSTGAISPVSQPPGGWLGAWFSRDGNRWFGRARAASGFYRSELGAAPQRFDLSADADYPHYRASDDLGTLFEQTVQERDCRFGSCSVDFRGSVRARDLSAGTAVTLYQGWTVDMNYQYFFEADGVQYASLVTSTVRNVHGPRQARLVATFG